MKKLPLYLVLCLSMFLTLSGWAYGTELKFNTENFAPFNYEVDGAVSGATADVVRRIYNEIKITCSLKLLPWRRTLREVKNGKAHAIFSIGWNEERTKWLYFSPPVLQTEYVFLFAMTIAFSSVM